MKQTKFLLFVTVAALLGTFVYVNIISYRLDAKQQKRLRDSVTNALADSAAKAYPFIMHSAIKDTIN